MNGRVLILAVGLTTLVAASLPTRAADLSAIEPYLADDVVGVAYVDLTKVDPVALLDEVIRLKAAPNDALEAFKNQATALQGALNRLKQSGARQAYVLLRTNMLAAGPTWIVEAGEAKQIRAVQKAINEFISFGGGRMARGTHPFSGMGFPEQSSVAEGKLVLGALNDDVLKRLQESRTDSPREEAVKALATLKNADAGVVIFGDAGSRRVVREMLPALPAPFMEIDGKLLADGVNWAAITLKFPPEPAVSFEVDTKSTNVAQTLERAAENGITLAKGFLTHQLVNGPPETKLQAKTLLDMLPFVTPKREEARLTIRFGDDQEEIAFLREIMPTVTRDAIQATTWNSRLNNFKQIALAIINYHDAQKSFPTTASRDKNGKPLLSWRVLILPYLEEGELYKQFHLDEPWDSEHNRKLIDKMPEVYRDPDPLVRAAIGDDGRTTYVAPIGEGFIFGGREPLKYSDIKDGTSGTIMAVEVVPERAVVWTKPDDWEVDPKDPAKGVKREDRPFAAAYADGHVMMITPIDTKGFHGALTHSGGETATPF